MLAVPSRVRALAWAPLLMLLACYPTTPEDLTAPGPSTPPPPPVPPTVGVVIYGTFISSSGTPLEWAGATVDVFDPSCTMSQSGVNGAGWAPPYKDGEPTYRTQMTIRRTQFDACLRIEVGYGFVGDNFLHRFNTTVPVTFTAQGATLAALAYHMDIVVP